jgi:hypothetical protein
LISLIKSSKEPCFMKNISLEVYEKRIERPSWIELKRSGRAKEARHGRGTWPGSLPLN